MSGKSQEKTSERRLSPRRDIVDTFSLFLVVPSKGVLRLKINDISETGIGFELDTEGESTQSFPIQTGDPLNIHVYINQSLYIPVKIKVVRIVKSADGLRKVGATFEELEKPNYQALRSFIGVLNTIVEVVQIDPSLDKN